MEIVFDDSPFVQLRFNNLARIEKLRELGFRITFGGWDKKCDGKFYIVAENAKSGQSFKFFFSDYDGMMRWSRGEKHKPLLIRRSFNGLGEETIEEMKYEASVTNGFGRLLEVEG